MLRTAFLSLIILVALTSSSSIIRRKLSRRQADVTNCHVIDGFQCTCSYFRVTCTTTRQLSTPIVIEENEKRKYQSVELVIAAEDNINVDDRTFEPVKELYKPDSDNVEFRLKFEKFTDLRLNSPGLLNRVFPESLPSNARKHVALEIYNPEVAPQDNPNLFQGLNADSLELYALYPFRGTFQQLFNGANIKFLRLSGGEIRSDTSQPFTGNIHRLEFAKQATALTVANFPVYPAHEMIINAFFISEFDSPHPPNYNNLGELRVQSAERIPAGAFRQYPNIHTLSVQSDRDIDPHAFDGLNNLEKLVIKGNGTTIEQINNLPNVKEIETNIEELDEKVQCKLIEKLANGQAAVQAIPNGRKCTCVSAYLDTAAGRTPCAAEDCDRSSCAAIKNNYDANTRQFSPPPAIQRADGSDALRPREARIYTAPFQIAQPDQEKLSQGIPTQPPAQIDDEEVRRPGQDGTGQYQPNQPYYPPHDQQGGRGQDDQQGGSEQPAGPGVDDNGQGGEGTDNRPDGDGTDNQPDGEGQSSGSESGTEGGPTNGTDTTAPGKRKMSWWPIIIVIAALVALALIGLIFLLLRKRRANKGYTAPGAKDGRPDTAVRT